MMSAHFSRLKRYFIAGVGVWLLILFGVSRMFLLSDVSDELIPRLARQTDGRKSSADEAARIDTVLEKIEKLQKQNDVLNMRLRNLRSSKEKDGNNGNADGSSDNSDATSEEYLAPSKQFEFARRKLDSGIIEFWRYASAHLKTLNEVRDPDKVENLVKEMVDFMTEQKRVILADIDNVERTSGVLEWKNDKAQQLSAVVQNRLKHLQNPANCSKARRLRCGINKACGFGCQLHHVTYCLMAGYALNRTVILDSKNWRYSRKGWESMFLPLSETCTLKDAAGYIPWKDTPENYEAPVVELPIIDNIQTASGNNKRPEWLPQAVPADLFSRIHAFHKNPPIWWLGQLLAYLWRYQKSTVTMMEELTNELHYKSPIVGVHVRRTDKIGTEASKHEVEEYMRKVAEYFDQLDVKMNKTQVRRVYLATDDPTVFREAREKFPDYEVIGNFKSMESAGLNKRYSDESLRGIITDINFLSHSDHLVCTFSSQVCRLAYELMQARVADATDNYDSLDDVYYYGGQNSHNLEAILPHEARTPEEISFKKGDLLGIAGNHWDGYSKGENLETNKRGIFPSYKAVEHFVTVEMPRYEDKEV
ncbi:hypothetical protein RvY_05772 [Ramazzottius varieornatus]|uniref:Alpha-(1,6)-fucosyltransferase n=1 Tax=Ramazzottius varieornatus TaxID=947166 RepID=A0A1D1UW79_RAMVA|nr:hypothetical protein RvY_05772 [Ramazzottius varieornatus]